MDTFGEIATTIKEASNMDGILANLQLAPNGVICLLHPLINTQDFEDGKYMDNTPAWGLDLFHDPNMKFIALNSIKQEQVGIAGPLQLIQCPDWVACFGGVHPETEMAPAQLTPNGNIVSKLRMRLAGRP